jgi:soluble lytic murein transglycosylase-like protein
MRRAGWRHYTMSRDQVRTAIVRAARRNAVSSTLALAIAWQESGWYEPLVSPAGAIGVMQVLPGTSDWMSLYASRHLNPRNTFDNVLAGILFLRYLGDRSDGHPGRTIASYYQGMSALDPHTKWYDDTVQYVRSVTRIARNLRRTGSPTG